jgi:uncharacterized protein (DUF1684 family)
MSPNAGVLVLLIATSVMPGAQSDYQKQILSERQQDQTRLQAEDSPIYVIGRHAIDEGRTTLGSAEGSTITLPQRAPAHLGTIERSAGTVTFTPSASVPVTLDGKRIEGPITLQTKDKADKLRAGDFSFTVQSIGESMILFLWDRQSSFAKNFHGLHWFPVDPAYKVEAKFTPYSDGKSAKVPDTQGGVREMPVPGFVTFELGGKTLRLDVFANSPDYWYLMFRDETSGKQTYGAGRYLHIDAPENGKAIVDFNKAYNPLCARSPFFACPLVPKDARLPVRVEAGEQYASSH